MENQDRTPHHCDICGKNFALSLTLRAHLVLHNREPPYKCGWCGEKFIRNSLALKSHMRWHLEVSSEDEEDCRERKRSPSKGSNKKFDPGNNSEYRLIVHKDPEHEFQCSICRKVYKSLKSLKHHMRQLHFVERPALVCEICKEVFEFKSGLERHFRKHKAEMNYMCDVCSKVFRSKKILSNHKKMKHCGESVNASIGNDCKVNNLMNPIGELSGNVVDKSTLEVSENVLENQYSTCTGNSTSSSLPMVKDYIERRYMCSVCGKMLPSEKSILNHMLTHAQTAVYSCNVCGIIFPNKMTFEKHTSKHGNYGRLEETTKVLCEEMESQEKITLYIKNENPSNKVVEDTKNNMIYIKNENSSNKVVEDTKNNIIMLEDPGFQHGQPVQDVNPKRSLIDRDRKDDVMVINEDIVIEVEEVIIAEKDDGLEDGVMSQRDPLL